MVEREFHAEDFGGFGKAFVMVFEAEDVELFVGFVPIGANAGEAALAVLDSFAIDRNDGFFQRADFGTDVNFGEGVRHGAFGKGNYNIFQRR